MKLFSNFKSFGNYNNNQFEHNEDGTEKHGE
jgi:hypothetical protein